MYKCYHTLSSISPFYLYTSSSSSYSNCYGFFVYIGCNETSIYSTFKDLE